MLSFKRLNFPSGLRQDYLSASSDLQEVLQLDPNVREAEQELEEVTALLRQSLMENAAKVKHTHCGNKVNVKLIISGF